MLEVALLGEQRVACDGRVVQALSSPRAIALLAYLLLHRGSPQPRQQVAGRFWPESTDAQARTNLRRELHELRAALPEVDRWLTTDTGTLLWRPGPGCRVDVAEFEAAAGRAARLGAQPAALAAAREAVAAYRGDLLPGLYDDWVLAERDRLRRMCVGLLDTLVTAEAGGDDLGAAIDHARRRLELEPLEERGYRGLIELQIRAGDRAAAMQTYHRCVAVLDSELGVAPDAATTALYDRLMKGGAPRRPTGVPTPRAPTSDPERRRPAAAPAGRPGGAGLGGGVDAGRAVGRVPLVGRRQELHDLLGCWRAAAGGAQLVVVTGEAGVGKSRLLDELGAAVGREGALVCRARCFPTSGGLALAPVSEWLRAPALRAVRSRLDPAWRREVSRLVPEPGNVGEPADRPQPMADGWQRHRFLEGLARAVLAADRALLLVLDDAQWCDQESLACLQLLLRLGAESPLLVVIAVRSDEAVDNPALDAVLRDSAAGGRDRMLELAPLPPDQTAVLAAAITGDPPQRIDRTTLHALTGGYPLLIVEAAMGRALAAGDRPLSGRLPRVHVVLSGRLTQLSRAAREVAALAAATGRDFSLELLTQASDLDAEVVVAAVDELWRRRIVREHSASTYDFVHDLLRETAYAEIPPARRRLLHRRLAQAMELIDDADPAAVAEQYEQGGRPKRAARHHVRAAESATRLFANRQAVQHYRSALSQLALLPAGRERDRTELSVRYDMSAPLNALQGYGSRELQQVLEGAHTLAERLGDSRLQLLSLVGLWAVRFVQGHIAESADIAARALRLSQLHPDVAGQAHLARAGSLTTLGRHAEALEHFAPAHDRSLDAVSVVYGMRAEVHARAWGAHALLLVGRPDEAMRWSEEAIARARSVDHPYSLAVALAYAAITAQMAGDVAGTLHLARAVQALCGRYDFAYYREWGVILEGWCVGGPDGVALIRAGLDALRRSGAQARMPYYLSLLAQTLAAIGDPGAGAALDAALSCAVMHDDLWWLPRLRAMDAERRGDADGTVGERTGS